MTCFQDNNHLVLFFTTYVPDGSADSDADAKTVCCGEERAEPESEALNLTVYLPSITYDHELWIVTEKNKNANTSVQNKLVPFAGWMGSALEIG